jgi:DNA-binding response OmpR family regulator
MPDETMSKQVLVVDDDSSIRESLKKVLLETGYGVALAANGTEAESELEKQQIDLLILDLNMPERDGWDVLERVNSNHPLLPVMMITGLIDQLDSTNIPGVSALLEKPIDVSVLLATMEDLLAETVEDRMRRVSGGLETRSLTRAGTVAPGADSTFSGAAPRI